MPESNEFGSKPSRDRDWIHRQYKTILCNVLTAARGRPGIRWLTRAYFPATDGHFIGSTAISDEGLPRWNVENMARVSVRLQPADDWRGFDETCGGKQCSFSQEICGLPYAIARHFGGHIVEPRASRPRPPRLAQHFTDFSDVFAGQDQHGKYAECPTILQECSCTRRSEIRNCIPSCRGPHPGIRSNHLADGQATGNPRVMTLQIPVSRCITAVGPKCRQWTRHKSNLNTGQ